MHCHEFRRCRSGKEIIYGLANQSELGVFIPAKTSAQNAYLYAQQSEMSSYKDRLYIQLHTL